MIYFKNGIYSKNEENTNIIEEKKWSNEEFDIFMEEINNLMKSKVSKKVIKFGNAIDFTYKETDSHIYGYSIIFDSGDELFKLDIELCNKFIKENYDNFKWK